MGAHTQIILTAAAAAFISAGAGAQTFDGRIASVSDADMAATAYADGNLEPLTGVRDALVIVEADRGGLTALGQVFASNSVISWPQVVEASPDSTRVYVVETRGEAPAGLAQMEDVNTDFPAGRRLQAFDVSNPAAPALIDSLEVGLNLGSVSRGPDGRWLVIASEDPAAEAVFVETTETGFGRVIAIDLDHPILTEARLRTLHWSPRGDLIAANLNDSALQFYAVERGPGGAPTGLSPLGETFEAGRHWSVGKWTPDGRFFLLTDVNWGEGATGYIFNGRGRLVSVEPRAEGGPRIADRLRVGRSPEGFDISPDGRLALVVNMERTYLPEAWYAALWPGRARSSLSLVAIDPETGALSREGKRVYFNGVLPEDAVFDTDGDMAAVAIFHMRRGEARRSGWLSLWRIEETRRGPRLEETGALLDVPRGAHDLVLLD